MSIRVAVIGAGSWGTTVAAIASTHVSTVLWCRRPELAQQINRERANREYLPGFELPAELRATASIADAVGGADVVVMGVPSHGYRGILADAAAHVRPAVPVVSLTKGLEAGTLARMSQVTSDVLPGHPVAVLTGPNLSKEVMAGHPTATVIATVDAALGSELQRILVTPRLRVYTNADVVGCEIAGVVKNVLAIAAGMAEGMGFGDNTKATLMTRGLAELTRFGVALGGDPATFTGLAGMGDLIATCSSAQSRNHMVGVALGRGRAIKEIVSEMRMVAEGVKSSPAVVDLARRVGVEMPISEQVVAVCHEGRSAREAVALLMGRQPRSEVESDR